MRLQYALFCQSVEDAGADGWTLRGVPKDGVVIEVPWDGSGERPSKAEFRIQLFMGFVECDLELHQLSIVAHRHGHPGSPIHLKPIPFQCAEGTDVHSVTLPIDFDIPPGRGSFTVRVLVDGEPMGETMLPVRFKVNRIT